MRQNNSLGCHQWDGTGHGGPISYGDTKATGTSEYRTDMDHEMQTRLVLGEIYQWGTKEGLNFYISYVSWKMKIEVANYISFFLKNMMWQYLLKIAYKKVNDP